MASASSAADAAVPAKKNHNKYRKEKPWDHAGIEHWKIEVCVDCIVRDAVVSHPLLCFLHRNGSPST